MCGIAAVISFKDAVSPVVIQSMTDEMSHRGPDSEGIFIAENKKVALGNRRLSLVDLSERGKQPMTKYGRTITFNGEIYNFREINKELEEQGYTFSSQSDTETILTAFEAYGIECLKKFNGAFAFVLHDAHTDQVYVVRDRVGEKPLVYIQTSQQIVIASDVRAIACHPEVKLLPNMERIISDLIFNWWSDKTQTHFQNIYSLPPGSYMQIKDNKVRITSYWDISVSEISILESDERYIARNTEELLELLQNATRLRIQADCEIGSMLSGGVDSSIVTTLASKVQGHDLKCFTLN